MKIFLCLALLIQNVRMTEDFLPLIPGNHWVYDISDEAGHNTGQLDFVVYERTIVAGRSVYNVSGFPFAADTTGPVRLIGYDREQRQFIRMSGTDELPLFTGEVQSVEVLQSDSSGLPQKFALHDGETTLVFQRGIGIIEARLRTSEGVRTAKIVSSSIGKGSAAASSAVAATRAPLPPAAPAGPVSIVAPVTAENPVLVVGAEPGSAGLKLELLVVNSSDKLLPFKFNSSMTYDFVISDIATDREIWRWSHGTDFAQVKRSDSIRGNAKWTFSEVWNRRDIDRNPVPPGRYRLVGILSSVPPIQSEPVIIDVQ